MDGVAEGLWELADLHEKNGEIAKSVKCLEAICQSTVSFLPVIEVKTRLRIATMLLKHSHNVNHAKSHLERSQLLLKSIPSCFELKCRAYSLLSQCYHVVGAVSSQKQLLNKGLELTATFGEGFSGKLWSCNFNSQLANALIIEGDYQGSISALEHGYVCASEMYYPELQMFFATSVLHVHLMQWEDGSLVEGAVNRCNGVWESIDHDKRQQCLGLFFYNELLHIFYLLRICDYKNAGQHVDKLDAAMKTDSQKMQHVRELSKELNIVNEGLSQPDLPHRDRATLSSRRIILEEEINNFIGPSSIGGQEALEPAYFGNVKREFGEKLELAPPPIDGEWLPKSAVYSLVDLMVVVFGRPKGLFKECGKRIQSGLNTIQAELVKYGIADGATEVDLQHSAIWMAGVYLMILMQFLENKVAMELTRSEFVEAQEALLEMRDWFNRFPTILQACESLIEMLRGQYAHCVACYSEAAFHFVEAAKLTESKSAQAICEVYAAVSYICIGDPDSYAKALELIGPVYRTIDSFVGVREKTTALFAYGFLLMRQENLQEARVRLASGLQTTHTTLGNLQLVSQYLTVLGNLALALHDTVQAREILRSSLTLAKKLYDIPTQIWVLSNLTALYEQVGEKGSEMENREYEKKKVDDLQKRLANAYASTHHLELIEKSKFQVRRLNEVDIKRAIAGPSTRVDLDIPESIGLSSSTPQPSSRLMDVDIGRRVTRKG
ncbi:sister chromatid cohesion protein SCC4 isoform X2 [Cynara cardunculus var. scolymus]|uniref:Cohesin loading factor n=1 Tax=Cynara cardunculus var. scolymus TaxID=59895 RepID=A0A103Y726_CYNCS|nr:sister chromatid cohesion protein SCC4 isoform X2 [Cynara cardunculus var. scolymus]KVI03704.1 Cohesin loading factor [Cynara cardunculus var. scolymus]